MKKKFIYLLAAGLICNLCLITSVTLAESSSINNTMNTSRSQLTDNTVMVTDMKTGTSEIKTIPSYIRGIAGQNLITEQYIPENLEVLEESEISPRVVVGEDDRQIVQDTTVFPYSTVCYLQVNYSDGRTVRGSAVMVSDNVALTAAHCVIHPGQSIDSITITPGKNNNTNPFGSTTVNTRITPSQYTTDPFNYDWAVLILDDNIGNQSGWASIKYVADFVDLTYLYVHIPGYPAQFNNFYQYSSQAMTRSCGTYIIEHVVDTTGGNSGSPMFERKNFNVVGIDTKEYTDRPLNIAHRVTQLMYDTVVSTINSH